MTHLRKRSQLDELAASKDADAVAQRLELLEDVRGEEDRLPAPLGLHDAVPESLFHDRIQPACGLVHDQKIGARRQGSDQVDLLAIALRVGAHLARRIEIETLDQLVAKGISTLPGTLPSRCRVSIPVRLGQKLASPGTYATRLCDSTCLLLRVDAEYLGTPGRRPDQSED